MREWSVNTVWRELAGRVAAICLLIFGTTAANAEDLPKTIEQAERQEQSNFLPASAFYSASFDLGLSKPGALLTKEAVNGYKLPPGAGGVRILYHSLSSTGRDVVSSAAVLTPGGPAPAGGWPVIAWAHGTSGVSSMCAPSAMKDVYYGDIVFNMLKAGFAVVAADYHGLGTPGPHEYVNKAAQANDVIYSIPAARAAVPTLGAKWVAVGHSQGGLAAWGVAEKEHSLKDPGFLGAVSVAGAIRGKEFFDHLNETPGQGFYLAFMAAGLAAQSPGFQPKELLSDEALAHYPDVTTKGCWYYGYAAFLQAPAGKLLRDGWRQNPAVEHFFAANTLGERPVGGPLLIIAGEGDQTVPIAGMRSRGEKMCAAAEPVTFKSYPGLDHDEVMAQSEAFQLDWIRDRFGGRKFESGCHQSH